MSQKLPVNDFRLVEHVSEFNEYVIERYNDESDEGYFLEVNIEYLENLQKLHNGWPFLPERMKNVLVWTQI